MITWRPSDPREKIPGVWKYEPRHAGREASTWWTRWRGKHRTHPLDDFPYGVSDAATPAADAASTPAGPRWGGGFTPARRDHR